jgi:hypothetical protein
MADDRSLVKARQEKVGTGIKSILERPIIQEIKAPCALSLRSRPNPALPVAYRRSNAQEIRNIHISA